jgi:PEGA domain-containing protein
VTLPRCTSLLLAAAFEACTLTAGAQATADLKAKARAHFKDGLDEAQNGDLTAALSAFEAAYAAQPNFSVLYNIGRARAGIGDHVAAIDAFERYLTEGGSRVDESRKAEVRSLLEASRRQVGSIKIIVAQADAARIWLDGKELRQEELAAPIRLSIGTHGLLSSFRGSAPISRTVNVQSSTVTEIALAAAPGLAELRVRCDLPGVQIFINDALRGQTPVASALSVPAGEVRIRFYRAGYQPVERSLEMQAKTSTVVDCAQHRESSLSADLAAHLRLGVEPRDADAFVDGERFSGAAVPSGPHQLTVTRDGYLPLTKSIFLPAQRTTEYAAALRPTPGSEAHRRTAIIRRHRVAYALAGTAAALLAASAGVYVWNSDRYDDWQARSRHDLDRALSIQRFDDLALGLLLGGVGVGAGGAWLYLSSP